MLNQIFFHDTLTLPILFCKWVFCIIESDKKQQTLQKEMMGEHREQRFYLDFALPFIWIYYPLHSSNKNTLTLTQPDHRAPLTSIIQSKLNISKQKRGRNVLVAVVLCPIGSVHNTFWY